MNGKIKLLFGKNKDEKTLETIRLHLDAHYKLDLELVEYSEEFESTENDLLLLYLSDEEIKVVMKKYLSLILTYGIIPNEFCSKVIRSYGISSDIFEALDDIFNTNRKRSVDLLFCNDEITFSSIIIGDVHGLNQSSILSESIFFKIKSFFSNLFELSFIDYNLVTAKGQNIETAATGIMVIEHSTHGLSKNLINEDLAINDGKLNVLILAPSSILAYSYYLLMSFFYHKFSINKLPKSIGVISTAELSISSSKPLDFVVDGVGMSAKSIDLEVKEGILSIQLGRLIHDEQLNTNVNKDEKDIIKIAGLPKGEMRNFLVNEPVPIFKKASEEDFKELFIGLKQNAVLATSFVVLMVLSTLLATTGLFQNSAPVIIGAMILAPLMSPIVSLSMGVARGEKFLIQESAYTLLIGVVTALAFSSLYTFFMPLTTITSEMSARLHPNILDLMVAIISGVAGAYANAKSEIAKSLAGVAIAVALVPPLSVTGIGIGYGEIDIIYGSFLLFITNLVGITLAGAVTFLILGYAPLHRAKKGMIYTSIFLALVSIPLVISFLIVLKQNEMIDKIEEIKTHKEMKMQVLKVDLTQDKPSVFIEIHSDEIPTKEELHDIKREIEDSLNEKIILDVTPKITIE